MLALDKGESPPTEAVAAAPSIKPSPFSFQNSHHHLWPIVS